MVTCNYNHQTITPELMQDSTILRFDAALVPVFWNCKLPRLPSLQAALIRIFTLISEAMRLNLWPKLKIQYPTEERGQLFIPAINVMLFLDAWEWYLFLESSNMEAAWRI
jgi:K+ transporter